MKLGLTLREFVLTRGVIDIHEVNGTVAVIRPRRATDGQEWLAIQWGLGHHGPCTFLNGNNRCDIHEFKPAECWGEKCMSTMEFYHRRDTISILKMWKRTSLAKRLGAELIKEIPVASPRAIQYFV